MTALCSLRERAPDEVWDYLRVARDDDDGTSLIRYLRKARPDELKT